MQKVALILAGVGAFVELRLAVIDGEPGVVPCGDGSCPKPPRVFAQRAELDFAVAEHVWIRRAPGAAFSEEVLEDALAILVAEIDPMQRQAELTCDLACILKVRRRCAMTVVFPVGHMQALDVVPGIAQQQRGDAGIDAAGQGYDGSLRSLHGMMVADEARCSDRVREGLAIILGSPEGLLGVVDSPSAR